MTSPGRADAAGSGTGSGSGPSTGGSGGSSIRTVVDNRWEVQNTKLGEGQFGKVYLGLDQKNNIKIAVKLINMNKLKRGHLERLKGETDILRQIAHPNIVKLYDQLNNEKYQLLMLEYMEGKDMYKNKFMVKGQPMEHHRIELFFGDLAAGLHELHHRKIIHRDLKPQNLLLTTTDPDTAKLKIADFGFARVLGGCDDMAQTIAGSPLYMAPEVLEAAVGHAGTNNRGYNSKADLYSAGVILYEMVSGHSPFQAHSPFQLLQEMKANRKKRLSHPDADLKHLVDSLLQPDPARRMDGEAFFANTWVLRCICARPERQAAMAAATAAVGLLVSVCKLPELGEKKGTAQWTLLTEKLWGARLVTNIATHMNPITTPVAVALYMKAATLVQGAWQILHTERQFLLAVVQHAEYMGVRQELRELFVAYNHHIESLLTADGEQDELADMEPADSIIFKHAKELCLRATVEETLQNQDKAGAMYREAQDMMRIVASDSTSAVHSGQRKTATRCVDMLSKRIKKTSLGSVGPAYG